MAVTLGSVSSEQIQGSCSLLFFPMVQNNSDTNNTQKTICTGKNTNISLFQIETDMALKFSMLQFRLRSPFICATSNYIIDQTHGQNNKNHISFVLLRDLFNMTRRFSATSIISGLRSILRSRHSTIIPARLSRSSMFSVAAISESKAQSPSSPWCKHR